MTTIDALLAEFDREFGVTRLLIERAPADRASWSPHPKSFTLGDICLHLANLPSWTAPTLRSTEFDLNPPDGGAPPRAVFDSMEATLRRFDANVAEARAALAGAVDAELAVPWTLKNGGETLFTMPRGAVLRTFVLNHAVHHRGQLSVYLRLCDVPLPPIYGPTADSA
ncbi:MAG TPA: DinB family protein [Gemmatimonadales bacterium]|nr:DinB family protein [Gemmatimonadales bacterium]